MRLAHVTADANAGYSLREVEKLLGLSRAVVIGLIDAGFVTPTRGRRREYRFSFPDLVVMRAAQGLTEARIPAGRILRSLRRLRAQLPDAMPLAGLRIEAVGDTVVVREGRTQWQPDSGQYMLQFDIASPGGHLAFFAESRAVVPEPAPQPEPQPRWYEQGLSLEADRPEAACDAYRQALACDPSHRDAYVNLGRLLHERGHFEEAKRVYRGGLDQCPADATLLFNLAVLHEDLKQPDEAVITYRAALDAAPGLIDAHHNLARLCANLGLQQEALRHWSAFRRLTSAR